MLAFAAFAWLQIGAAAAPQSADGGCLVAAAVVDRTKRFVEKDWRRVTPRVLTQETPGPIRVVGRTGDGTPAMYARMGVHVDGKLHCGETYSFVAGQGAHDPTVGLRLEEISVVHSEESAEEAIAVARALIEAIGPPEDATQSDSVTIDGALPKDPLFHASYQWTTGALPWRESVVVHVVRESGIHLISAVWRRRNIK